MASINLPGETGLHESHRGSEAAVLTEIGGPHSNHRFDLQNF